MWLGIQIFEVEVKPVAKPGVIDCTGERGLRIDDLYQELPPNDDSYMNVVIAA